MQVERTPNKAITERNPKQPAIGDVLTTHALAGDPENDRASRILSTKGRVERAAKLVRAPLPESAVPAIVSAIFSANGERLRSLPLANNRCKTVR